MDFYRNVLGLRLVKQTVNEDDRAARHLFFGDEHGRPGTMVTCLEYPQLDEAPSGSARPTTSPSRSAPDEELDGWRAYLESRGVECTAVLDRTYFKSVYLRDPDGHILELATLGPGVTVDVSLAGASSAPPCPSDKSRTPRRRSAPERRYPPRRGRGAPPSARAVR